MDQFFLGDGQYVRLRSRVRGTYLRADEDGEGVSLHPQRASMNAAWAVHLLQVDGEWCVLLHGAYGRYLALAHEGTAAPTGHHGRPVVQAGFHQQTEQDIAWRAEVVTDGFLRLAHAASGLYLRGNGRHLRWRNGVTADDPTSLSEMTHWALERLQIIQQHQSAEIRNMWFPGQMVLPGQRSWIRRLVTPEQVQAPNRQIRLHVPEGNDVELNFYGRSAHTLRQQAVDHSGIITDDIILCVRAGPHGRLTPLMVNLPSTTESMDVTVVRAGSQAANAMAPPYPNVFAP